MMTGEGDEPRACFINRHACWARCTMRKQHIQDRALPQMSGLILTVGHSTRSLDDFIALLRAHGVQRLVDVRRFPGSRRYPHFGAESLARALPREGIQYSHEPDLGGRRTAGTDSPNTAWRSAGFRAYADYMATPLFAAALARLLAHAADAATAIMCAEAVPWRCHRQLIADALVARGHEVRHITAPTRAEPHRLNPHAVVGPGGTLTYPRRSADEPTFF
jgi:uncharacterized protein (DUF488 family)